MSSASDSDIELKSALPKKHKKTPKSPSDELLKKNREPKKIQPKNDKKTPKSPSEELQKEPKKITTKEMIKEALNELKTRKGTSLYAIKKYLTDKHNVDIDKMNHHIKKNIKTGIEDGTIVQTKGAGVSGSFKLAPKKKPDPVDKPKKKKKTNKEAKTKKEGEKSEKTEKKVIKKKSEEKVTKKTEKKESEGKKKPAKSKTANVKTPTKKKAAIMKRKSIGSIIKAPKMRPKAHA